MAITKITDDQLRFISANTGEHVLGDYLENAEKGSRTLGDLLNDLFDETGALNADLIQWRVNPATRAIQTRTGQFVDPNLGWVDTGDYYYRHRGAWAASTAYKQTDTIIRDGIAYFAKESHTSTSTFDATKWVSILDETLLTAIVAEAQGYATAAEGSADAAAASAQAAQDAVDSINMPAGVANTFLRRNDTNTAYETKTPTEVGKELTLAISDDAAFPATTGTVTFDLATATNYRDTLTGNVDIETPLNFQQGMSGVIIFINGATPYDITSWSSAFKFEGGEPLTLTQEAGAEDVFVWYADTDTTIVVVPACAGAA